MARKQAPKKTTFYRCRDIDLVRQLRCPGDRIWAEVRTGDDENVVARLFIDRTEHQLDAQECVDLVNMAAALVQAIIPDMPQGLRGVPEILRGGKGSFNVRGN